MSTSGSNPAPKLFGKIEPGKPLPLRSYEVYFGIIQRTGPDAWVSSSPSVQKLLDHLSRYTQSYSSRETYLRNLQRFCQDVGKSPEELIALSAEDFSDLLEQYAAKLKRSGQSRSYINGIIKRIKTFARCNKLVLEVQSYHQPSRYRRTPEYIPTKDEIYRMANDSGGVRNRAMVLGLWSSGIRVSTLLALNYGDVKEELEAGEEIITIPIFPELKDRVPDACKGNIPYTTFICREATEALQDYLRDRVDRYGPIDDDDPLFSTDWNQIARADRAKNRCNRMTVSKLVHKAAKRAGIKQWEDVHPHSLRKSFKSVLVAPTVDGGHMDMGTQEFLFGHILPGTQDPYFDKTKLDVLKAEYSKLNFTQESSGPEGANIMMAALRAAMAGSGKDPDKIINAYVEAKHGSQLPWKLWDMEKQAKLMQEAMEWENTQDKTKGIMVKGANEEGGSKTQDKVIDVEELEGYLHNGWVFVSNVGSEKCVLRKIS